MTKTDDEHVDLELLVKEAKTGSISAEAGFGGQANAFSPTTGMSIRASIENKNCFGTGARFGLSGNYARQDSSLDCYVGSNWLFDRPISGSAQGFARQIRYEDFRLTEHEPIERRVGGALHGGLRPARLNYAALDLGFGYEKITYKTDNKARSLQDPEREQVLQLQIDRSLQAGKLLWLTGSIIQDLRDHPLYPSNGYKWALDVKFGLPFDQSCFGFARYSFDCHWYTTLIAQYGLVLHLHGFLGAIDELGSHRIPYGELFNFGGPQSVRGFTYGQISPALLGSPLGGTRGLVANAELQFPISPDGNIRGIVFYDGGACWHTPDAQCIPNNLLSNNSFEYRHAIGIGINIERPTPIRVELGIKLDRKKRRGENLTEVHIGMAQAF